jgi:hypothetical protein
MNMLKRLIACWCDVGGVVDQLIDLHCLEFLASELHVEPCIARRSSLSRLLDTEQQNRNYAINCQVGDISRLKSVDNYRSARWGGYDSG